MKRKIIAGIFLVIMLIFFRQYISNAANEDSQLLEVTGNLDQSKEYITINFNATDIKGIQCQLIYDDEVLEYVTDSLQGKNNWAVGLNSETLYFVSGNEENIEKTDIGTIQFRIKNEEDTIKTNISLNDIKIVKSNGEASILDNRNYSITIDRTSENTEENIITEEGKPKDDDGNEITEGETEEDKVIDYGADLEDTGEGNQENNPVSIKTDDEVDEESNEIEEIDSISGTLQNSNNETNGSKEQGEATINNSQEGTENNQSIVKQIENLADKVLPKTGLARIMLPIIVILVIIACMAYRKFKSIKEI